MNQPMRYKVLAVFFMIVTPWTAVVHAQAFMLMDEVMWDNRPGCHNSCEYYYENGYVRPYWSVPQGVPSDWRQWAGQGIDYSAGALHWYLNILSMKSKKTLSCKLCLIQALSEDEDETLHPAKVYLQNNKKWVCTSPIEFDKPGNYFLTDSIAHMEGAASFDFTKCNPSTLSKGYGTALALVMYNEKGELLIGRYIDGEVMDPSLRSDYYPIELHSLAAIIAKNVDVDPETISDRWPDTTSLQSPLYALMPLKINVGGRKNGQYVKDKPWIPNGDYGYVDLEVPTSAQNEYAAIANANNQQVYQSCRVSYGFGDPDAHGKLPAWQFTVYEATDFAYRIRTTNNRHRVTLKFAELWPLYSEWFPDSPEKNVSDKREFSVTINGASLQQQPLIIEDQAGGRNTALDLSLEVAVSNEIIDIQLLHGKSTPILNGIEVECLDCPISAIHHQKSEINHAPFASVRKTNKGIQIDMHSSAYHHISIMDLSGRALAVRRGAGPGPFTIDAAAIGGSGIKVIRIQSGSRSRNFRVALGAAR
jgi:hypothetical protein